MTINTREGLKQYCLRALGSPVLEINVDDDQLEDRIDEALEYWRLYHPEGIEQVYAKYMITASVFQTVQVTTLIFMNGTTDYVEIWATQSVSQALGATNGTYFQAAMIRSA